MTMAEGELAIARAAFVRQEPAAALPPPRAMRGVSGWVLANLLSSMLSVVLTAAILALLLATVPEIIRYLLIDAVWTGVDRNACLPADAACWPFIWDRFNYFIYASYPIPERWRVNVFFVMLAIGIVWLLWLNAPRRRLGMLYFFVVLPVASIILLHGSRFLGLPIVDTALWGGMMVTVVVATTGIVVSLPIGIVLALGRRSDMPAVRILSMFYIEFVRGVPLITVLFMASVMLPLFLSSDWSPDKLLRALVGVSLFSAAYMAEVVRAGLEAIPRGQREAAYALGLGYWRTQTLITLPQALRITIPNLVNTSVGLFKDTTLVFIVGIFDFLRTIEISRSDPKWAAPTTSTTGYAFAALIYFVMCYAMTAYARRIERRLARSDR